MVRCGHVYFLFLPIAGKEKLVVPAFITADGRVRYFIINSERTDFQSSRVEISKHVLPLQAEKNLKFLTHDSWLTCHELLGGPTADEVEKIKNSYRAPLDAATLATVRSLIGESRLHSISDKTAILAQWPQK